ncbi:MAG: choice-of-anchor J domain-containing protein [Massilia sp.]
MKFLKTRYAAAALSLAAFAPASYAAGQEVLNQGFDNVASLPGWSLVNHSVPAGNAWFQGNSGVFPSQSGTADAYIGASFLGAAHGAGSVDNWLITPLLDLSGSTTLSFFTRAELAGYADQLEVRFASGSDTGTDSFSTLLATVGGTGYPTTWQEFSASVNVEGPGRFAFRYLGDAAALSYVGIDSVRVVTAVPEPSLYLMLAMGLGALALMRRKLVD